MRIFATLALLAAIVGGVVASASASNCTTTCDSYGGGNRTCTRTCF
jgi:hypothetical protein